MTSVEVFSPAKINLFLAVTGRRADGFHDIVSVAAPIDWGDRLAAEGREPGGTTLECSDSAVPTDARNLVLRAAAAYRRATGWEGGAHFILEKRTPMGAGLGGGSSNAAAALRALERLSGRRTDPAVLAGAAAEIGSDCVLFLHPGPVVMRGRGERTEPLPESAVARLRGRRLIVFKPGFSVATPWAYGRLAEAGRYMPPAQAERRLAAWIEAEDRPAEELLYNGFEQVVFDKFPALPAVMERLRERFGLTPGMSGSGSACFVLLPDRGGPDPEAVASVIRGDLGESALAVETRVL